MLGLLVIAGIIIFILAIASAAYYLSPKVKEYKLTVLRPCSCGHSDFYQGRIRWADMCACKNCGAFHYLGNSEFKSLVANPVAKIEEVIN